MNQHEAALVNENHRLLEQNAELMEGNALAERAAVALEKIAGILQVLVARIENEAEKEEAS